MNVTQTNYRSDANGASSWATRVGKASAAPVVAEYHRQAARESEKCRCRVVVRRPGRPSGIIPIVSPGRMMEMNDAVAVVGGNGLTETDLSDTAPVLE